MKIRRTAYDTRPLPDGTTEITEIRIHARLEKRDTYALAMLLLDFREWRDGLPYEVQKAFDRGELGLSAKFDALGENEIVIHLTRSPLPEHHFIVPLIALTDTVCDYACKREGKKK